MQLFVLVENYNLSFFDESYYPLMQQKFQSKLKINQDEYLVFKLKLKISLLKIIMIPIIPIVAPIKVLKEGFFLK